MIKKMVWLMMLALLAGCAAPTGSIGSQPTADNIFVPSTSSTAPSIADTTDPTTPSPTQPVSGGSMSCWIVGEEQDENDYICLRYTGGEMHLPIYVSGTGIFPEYGIGILIFVDGKPQPYRTNETEEYKYVHHFTKEIYSVQENGRMVIDTDLIFTPMAGQAGEYVSCNLITLGDPDYSYGTGSGTPGWKYTSMSSELHTWLKMEADPPDTEPLAVTDQLLGFDITTVEVTQEEIEGWTDDDMMKYTRHKIYVNDRDLKFTNVVWGVTTEKESTIRFEVYGSPYIHYELVIFMDNQPLSLAEEDIIKVSIESGRKTIVTAKLNMSDFDGESVVYCMLIPLNKEEYRGQGIRAGLIVSRYCFLLDDPYPY